MESGQKREMKRFDGTRPGLLPAVVASVAGVLGLVVIVAAPWLLLTSDAARLASEQPAFQAARAFPSVAETRRILFNARPQGGTRETGVILAAGPSLPAR